MFTYKQRITPDLAIPLIQALYKNSDKFAGDAAERKWYELSLAFWTEYGRALHVLMMLIEEKIEEEKTLEILEEVISNASYVAFSADILNKCLTASDEKYYKIKKAIDLNVIGLEKLKRLTLIRFMDVFIEKGENIFDLKDERDRGLILYLWSFHAETENQRTILKGYILSLIKDKPEEFVKFLKHQVHSDFGRRLVMDIEVLNKAYGLSELRFLANKFKNDESLTPEEKEIIEMFLKEADEKQEPAS